MSAQLIPIFGMLIPIVIVPAALGFRYSRQVRELEHKERMRALEVGRTLPQDEPWSSPARICLSIAVGVPIAAFGSAWLTTSAVGFRDGVWAAACMVGVTAVISGSLLASKHLTQRDEAERRAANPFAKPQDDADAFDVVGSRG